MNHQWPGNNRELKNCLERAAIIGDGEYIEPEHLSINNTGNNPDQSDPDKININLSISPDEFSLDKVIKDVMQLILDQNSNNKSRAAELLKIDRKMFYRRA